MFTIYKYPIELMDESTLELPAHSKPVSVGLDPQGQLCLWAVVQPDVPSTCTWGVCVIGTGHPVPDEIAQVGTDWIIAGRVNQGPFVWHVFLLPGD